MPSRPSNAPVPNERLLTHTGRAVRFYDDLVRGRVVLVSFMYTRCAGSCPLTTQRLLQIQRLLGERLGSSVFMLSVTLDPEKDGPEVLRAYAQRIGARPGWEFLTGAPAAIDRLRRGLGFRDPDPRVDADRSQHASVIALGNDRRARWAAVPAAISAEHVLEALDRVEGRIPAQAGATCAPATSG